MTRQRRFLALLSLVRYRENYQHQNIFSNIHSESFISTKNLFIRLQAKHESTYIKVCHPIILQISSFLARRKIHP
jgi:hypothetical protein